MFRSKKRFKIDADDIRSKLDEIKVNVKKACAKSKRKPEDVRILVVTRGRTVPEIREVVKAGCKLFGENRVQEGVQKRSFFDPDVEWHLIGHLQSVKTKTAVEFYSLIHTVDSLRIGFDLQNSCEKTGHHGNVLIQINTTDEDTPFGILPSETIPLIKELVKFPCVHIRGLMTEAPQVDDPEQVRPYFRRLRELRDKIKNAKIDGVEMKYLSMGDSHDYAVAVEEGSNIIRITSPIFEEE